MKVIKTNAIRILDQAKLAYEISCYEHGKDALDGITVASILHQNPDIVFKTLVTKGNNNDYYVFVVPVAHELNLKKCAKAVGVKHIEMIHVRDINTITGYIRGGCSPIGMKKHYPTIIHESCLQYTTILFSGGKIGIQIAMSPNDLISLIHAKTADIIQ